MSRIIRKDKAGKWSNIAGILAIIWMCIIFSFSAQTKEESSVVSEGLSYRMVSGTGLLFHLHMDEEQLRELAASIERSVRKCAHMTEFAILAILFYGWMCRGQMSRKRRACLAAILTMLYACSDEFHQLFVTGRAGKFSDVLVDCAGALLGLALFFLAAKVSGVLRRRRKAGAERHK